MDTKLEFGDFSQPWTNKQKYEYIQQPVESQLASANEFAGSLLHCQQFPCT